MDLAPVSKGDFEALLNLIRTSFSDLDDFDLEQLEQQTFSDPDKDISYLIKSRENQKMTGAILGVTRRSGKVKAGFIKFLAVESGFRRQKIATYLLKELERRFQKRGITEVFIGACGAPYIRQGIDLSDMEAVSFFEKRGYHRIQAVCDLMLDAKECAGINGLREDLEVYQVLSGNGEHEIKWIAQHFSVNMFLVKYCLQKGVLVIIRDSNRMLGFASLGAMQPNRLGPCGVLAEAQGQGAGKTLLTKICQIASTQKKQILIVPQVNEVGFLVRHFSAKMDRVFWQMSKKI